MKDFSALPFKKIQTTSYKTKLSKEKSFSFTFRSPFLEYRVSAGGADGERERNPFSFLTKLVRAYEDVKPSLYPIKHFWCSNDVPLVYFHKTKTIQKIQLCKPMWTYDCFKPLNQKQGTGMVLS